MRNLVVSVVVGCFLTSATSCTHSDPCGAAAAKVSECTGQEIAAMDSCDSEAAERLLAASCDQITEHPGKAISTGGWIAIALAAAVGGWFLLSHWGGGNDQGQASSTPAASNTGQPPSPAYAPDHRVQYGSNLGSFNTTNTPVNYVAPSTAPLTNSYAANTQGQPASSGATASRARSTGPASAGPADKTNAKGCQNLTGATQCVGRIHVQSLQAQAGNYHFQVVAKTATCNGGAEFRICRDVNGNCGLEYCLPNGGGYTGRCSADLLQAGNNPSLDRNFTQGTADGKALGCSATSGQPAISNSPPTTAATNNPPGVSTYPCHSGGCSYGGTCTIWGCVTLGSIPEGFGCTDTRGAVITALCKPGLSCQQQATADGSVAYACQSPNGGSAGSPTPSASGQCTIGGCDYGVCTASGCTQPHKGQTGDPCVNKNGAPVSALCESNTCIRSGSSWQCAAAPSTSTTPGAGNSCPCAGSDICTAEGSCAAPGSRAVNTSCTDSNGQGNNLLCASRNCQAGRNGHYCLAASSNPSAVSYTNDGPCTKSTECGSGDYCNMDRVCVGNEQVTDGGSCSHVENPHLPDPRLCKLSEPYCSLSLVSNRFECGPLSSNGSVTRSTRVDYPNYGDCNDSAQCRQRVPGSFCNGHKVCVGNNGTLGL